MKRISTRHLSILRFVGIVTTAVVITWLICTAIISCTRDNAEQQRLESVQSSRFLMYGDDGQLYGTDFDLMIDKETGVQYVYTGSDISPLYNPDGTLYVTIE